jgi:malonate-semialdehyde dehydrogenase (acetylating)/methylmalonate-semialdehyde dehydrogenase
MEVKKLKNYINGEWVESKTNRWLEVRNPAKDEVISLCPETTKEIDER